MIKEMCNKKVDENTSAASASSPHYCGIFKTKKCNVNGGRQRAMAVAKGLIPLEFYSFTQRAAGTDVLEFLIVRKLAECFSEIRIPYPSC